MTRENELQAAITCKCLECSCGMRGEVRDCKLKSCALWPYRPYQRAKVVSAARETPRGRQMDVFEVLEAIG